MDFLLVFFLSFHIKKQSAAKCRSSLHSVFSQILLYLFNFS